MLKYYLIEKLNGKLLMAMVTAAIKSFNIIKKLIKNNESKYY